MNATTATSTPAEQVGGLIQMVLADENQLEVGDAFFASAGPVGKKAPKPEAASVEPTDSLEARLATNMRS